MMLIAVVLGADSSQDRFSACKSMLDYGFANYALTEYTPEQLTVPVQLGQQAMVSAIPGGDTRLLIDKSQRNDIHYQVELEESVSAPVSQGQKIGTLSIRAGDHILAQIPLVAQTPVLRKTWGQIFWQILRAVCLGK
jgi:D-alanyl-D-alanine carboxypeptidase (penicillin-binding protein 5/6)